MNLLIIFSSALLFVAAIETKAEELKPKNEMFQPELMFRRMRSNFEGALKNQENPLSKIFGSQLFKTSETGGLEKSSYGASQSAGALGSTDFGLASLKRSADSYIRPEEESSSIFSKGGSEKMVKLMSNPSELLDVIAKHFNLDSVKLKEQVGRSVSLGTETLMSPALIGVQIIEKVFVPDKCRLKLMCNVGRSITKIRNDSIFRIQPKHTDSSHYMRAFTQGFHGNDCEGAFPNCEPTLQKPYENFMASAGQTFASRKNKSSA